MGFSYSTLFNIGYIDKGIALYNSIRAYNENSVLYILCLDSVTELVLQKHKLHNAVLISVENIEKFFPYLKQLKTERSFAEYCWTLTPHIIEYVFTVYNEKYNTYLDSDLYFFSDPDILNNEMLNNGDCTLITEHRFMADEKRPMNERLHGKYCVQYNTFTNSNESGALLERWKANVIADCEYNKRKNKAGDQKYLEEFPVLSTSVYIPQNIGAGVAPWNIKQYKLLKANDGNIRITDGKQKAFVVFYHYQNIKYISKNIVNVGAGRCDLRLKKVLYYKYLREIEAIRKDLGKERIGMRSRSVSKNRLIAFAQKYMMRFKLREFSISDIIFVRRLKDIAM